MVGEMSGLSNLLRSEQARCSRFLKRKKGLELELDRVKKDTAEALSKERLGFGQEISVVSSERDALRCRVADLESKLQVMTTQLTDERLKRDSSEKAYASLELVNAGLKEDLLRVDSNRGDMEKLLTVATAENELLKASLASMPSRETAVAEYCASDEYKRDIVNARVAAVEAYKCSDEFEEEMRDATDRGVAGFKSSAAFAEDLAKVRETAISDYRGGNAFKEAVGVEAGKLSMRIVDCCREFLKDNLQRPTQEFGEFFRSFVCRQRDNVVSGYSSGGSGTRSSVS